MKKTEAATPSRVAQAKEPTASTGKKRAASTGANEGLRYHQLLEHLPVGVYRTTRNGRIIDANPALAAMLGVKRAEDLKRVRVDQLYVHPEDRRNHLEHLEAARPAFWEFELKTLDGRHIWVQDFPRAVPDGQGAVLHYDGILVDVTDRKQAVMALNRSEQDYRSLFENAHDAILIFSLSREIILDANPRACELYGYHRQELVGMLLSQLSADKGRGNRRPRRIRQLRVLRNFETTHLRKDGTEMVLEINSALMEYKGHPAILAIGRDITERKRMEETIRRLAFHDYLTGLPNRLLLSDRLRHALEHSRRRNQALALLFLDLDHFKEINDRHGHNCGDRLLRSVADRLQRLLRRSDTVARMGGDEFVILLSDIRRPEDALSTAGKIREELRLPFAVDGLQLQISGSIGVAIYPQDGEDGETLLRKADRAMYQVKERSRNACLRFGAD